MALNVPNPLVAKQMELYGAGFGALKYKGYLVELVSNFRDQGQPALGSPVDIMTINDQYPRAIVPPMAMSSGTLSFDTYSLKTNGIWGTIFNGQFEGAKSLVELFNKQLNNGAIEVQWITLDLDGVPTKVLTYEGLVVVDGQRNLSVDNRGANVATYSITCKYTVCRETEQTDKTVRTGTVL